MDRSLHRTRASDGQALLLAVLIMIAILLIGTLPIATGCGNQQQEKQAGTTVADETDLYTLEVLKDRKEKVLGLVVP